MSQHALPKLDMNIGELEEEIRQRLRRAKARLLAANVLFFTLAMAFILFVI